MGELGPQGGRFRIQGLRGEASGVDRSNHISPRHAPGRARKTGGAPADATEDTGHLAQPVNEPSNAPAKDGCPYGAERDHAPKSFEQSRQL